MAQLRAEVRPVVSNMPTEGFTMQTGGSARRRVVPFDTSTSSYRVTVPGHTHNASAVCSVLVDNTEKSNVDLIINNHFAYQQVQVAAERYTDSYESHEREYDRALERGRRDSHHSGKLPPGDSGTGPGHWRAADARDAQGQVWNRCTPTWSWTCSTRTPCRWRMPWVRKAATCGREPGTCLLQPTKSCVLRHLTRRSLNGNESRQLAKGPPLCLCAKTAVCSQLSTESRGRV